MTNEINQRFYISFLVAVIFSFLDYLFHAFFTAPFEIPAYFVYKFIIAFIITMFVLSSGFSTNRVWLAAFFNGVWVVIYYRLLLPLYPNISQLGQIPTIASVSATSNLFLLSILWFAAHYSLYLIAAYIVWYTLDSLGADIEV